MTAEKLEVKQPETKATQLMAKIKQLLPDDRKKSAVGVTLNVRELSEQVGMVDMEFHRFMEANKGLFVRAKGKGSQNLYTFIEGHETVADVLETIDIFLRKDRNIVVHNSEFTRIGIARREARRKKK